MIDFPIIDTHLHLWDPQKFPYPWLASAPLLNKRYLLEDYNRACGRYAVEKMVFVQCEIDPAHYKDECDWVASLAKQDHRIAGIVPWAPLEQGAAAEPALESLAANPLVKGIRRIIQFETDPNFCLQPGFIEGVTLLSRFGLSFDICVKGETQTVNVIELVKRCPNVTFILDHIGKPWIDQRKLDPWKTHIKALASMPNVWCKISGLVVEADWKRWTAGDLRPYLDHVLESFTIDRVMFGGDWPVVLNASELDRWIDTLDRATSVYSPTERKRLFRENARSFYRLG